MIIITNKYKEQIKTARKLIQQSQSDIAESVGLSTTSYNYIETGKSDPKFSTLEKIFSFFISEGIIFHPDGDITFDKRITPK